MVILIYNKENWVNYIAKGDRQMVAPIFLKLLKISYEQHVFSATHKKGNIWDLILSNKCFAEKSADVATRPE